MIVLSTRLRCKTDYNQTEHAHERGNSREKLDDIRKYENT